MATIIKLPFRVIITHDIASGKHAPAAKNVKPITISGMCNVLPIIDIIKTIKYEFKAIHTIHIIKVNGYNERNVFGLGIVSVSKHFIGQV